MKANMKTITTQAGGNSNADMERTRIITLNIVVRVWGTVLKHSLLHSSSLFELELIPGKIASLRNYLPMIGSISFSLQTTCLLKCKQVPAIFAPRNQPFTPDRLKNRME